MKPITFSSPEGEAYQSGREDGIRTVISWIKTDTQEQELAQELKELFPQYYAEIR